VVTVGNAVKRRRIRVPAQPGGGGREPPGVLRPGPPLAAIEQLGHPLRAHVGRELGRARELANEVAVRARERLGEELVEVRLRLAEAHGVGYEAAHRLAGERTV
jgi:hypothetical protein